MKILINDGKIVGTATDEYEGPYEFIQVDDKEESRSLDNYRLVDGSVVYKDPVPQEVTMAQCRLALFDIHGIEIDEKFYALADVLPQADRARARLELRTRPTVRYDNPLVIAFCDAMGWDRDELFSYGAQQ